MPATEPIQGGPYPEPSDPPDGPNQLAALAVWAAGRLVMRFASPAARDAAITSPVEGMLAITGTGATQALWLHTAAAWRNITPRSAVGSGGSPVSTGALVRGTDAPAVMGDGVSVFKITITITAAYSTASGDSVALFVLRADNSVVLAGISFPITGAWANGRTLVLFDTPPAGSMTYAIGWQRVAGTGSCAVQSSQIMVERIA